MHNSLTRALIDGPALLAPLRGAANFDAMVKPVRLRLVSAADRDAPAARPQDIDAEIDGLLIF